MRGGSTATTTNSSSATSSPAVISRSKSSFGSKGTSQRRVVVLLDRADHGDVAAVEELDDRGLRQAVPAPAAVLGPLLVRLREDQVTVHGPFDHLAGDEISRLAPVAGQEEGVAPGEPLDAAGDQIEVARGCTSAGTTRPPALPPPAPPGPRRPRRDRWRCPEAAPGSGRRRPPPGPSCRRPGELGRRPPAGALPCLVVALTLVPPSRTISSARESGGIGRRARFRILSRKRGGGSSPPFRTTLFVLPPPSQSRWSLAPSAPATGVAYSEGSGCRSTGSPPSSSILLHPLKGGEGRPRPSPVSGGLFPTPPSLGRPLNGSV